MGPILDDGGTGTLEAMNFPPNPLAMNELSSRAVEQPSGF